MNPDSSTRLSECRTPLATAEKLVEEIQERLAVSCLRIAVVGSIRRKEALPTSVDLVCIPRNQGLLACALRDLAQRLKNGLDCYSCLYHSPASGAVCRGEHLCGNRIQLGDYHCRPHRQRQFCLPHGSHRPAGEGQMYADGSGLEINGRLVFPRTEPEVFEALGMAYTAPEDRYLWPEYIFKTGQAKAIEGGTVCQTIVPRYKVRLDPQPGRPVLLCRGMRNSRHQLMRAARVAAVHKIEFSIQSSFQQSDCGNAAKAITVDGKILSPAQVTDVINAEGWAGNTAAFFAQIEKRFGIPNRRPLLLVKWDPVDKKSLTTEIRNTEKQEGKPRG